MQFDKDMINAMKSAKKVLVFTGAGISKESGLPTFRDLDGIWTKYDPMTFATLEGFLENPVLVWNNYRMRQQQISAAQPNPGHFTIAKMEQHYPDFLLVTQNVDDLHERAGNRKIVKLHGDAFSIKCLKCNRKYRSSEYDLPEQFDESTLPRCKECGGLCRPDIVWFGEYLDPDNLTRAHDFACTCDLTIVVGTSGEVSGGYGLVQATARRSQPVIEINPRETALTDYASYAIREHSGAVLPEIWKEVLEGI